MNQTDQFNFPKITLKIEDAIIKDVGSIKGLDLIPSHLKLTFIDISLATAPFRDVILKKKLASVLNNYDFILCDCPPNLSLSTQNGLAASDYYIIPVFAEPLAALGLGLISNRIKEINEYMDRHLQSLGIVFSRYDLRTKETELTAYEIIENNPNEYIFQTKIPQNVKIQSAIRNAMPVILTAQKSSGAKAYRDLAKEFINRVNSIQDFKKVITMNSKKNLSSNLSSCKSLEKFLIF